MEDSIEHTDSTNPIIDEYIHNVHAALDQRTETSTSGPLNQLENLVNEFAPNESTEESTIDIIEEIILESDPNRVLKSSRSQSAASSSLELTEKPKSFFARLFSRTHRRTEPTPSIPSLPSIPSVNSTNDQHEIDSSALLAAETQINALEQQGPAGLAEISALGNAINRRIQVWTSSMTLVHEVGKTRPGEALNIQYHTQGNQVMGHWTLLGNQDPDQVEAGLNDCLFATIAAQTGHKPSELRAVTAEKMKRNITSLGNRIQELARLEKCGSIVVMVGGARYTGRSPQDAKTVIDNSQQGRCHPGHMKGHPRGHASNPSATGAQDSAEKYSASGWKTAFLSREDQDNVGHQALTTKMAQDTMERLNSGKESLTVEVPATELSGPLPQGAHFNDGVMGQVRPIKTLILVLRHHAGHANDPDHDVFVHTFYPKLG